ncbi:hypothetical protein JB92DRAFT_3285537 [Gautieria morchelliformis]|nr:hypothetical protein JB92DRAFT_3285537 [Gautieria morchelliformis]
MSAGIRKLGSTIAPFKNVFLSQSMGVTYLDEDDSSPAEIDGAESRSQQYSSCSLSFALTFLASFPNIPILPEAAASPSRLPPPIPYSYTHALHPYPKPASPAFFTTTTDDDELSAFVWAIDRRVMLGARRRGLLGTRGVGVAEGGWRGKGKEVVMAQIGSEDTVVDDAEVKAGPPRLYALSLAREAASPAQSPHPGTQHVPPSPSPHASLPPHPSPHASPRPTHPHSPPTPTTDAHHRRAPRPFQARWRVPPADSDSHVPLVFSRSRLKPRPSRAGPLKDRAGPGPSRYGAGFEGPSLDPESRSRARKPRLLGASQAMLEPALYQE